MSLPLETLDLAVGLATALERLALGGLRPPFSGICYLSVTFTRREGAKYRCFLRLSWVENR
jgi:hypothetical protein